MKAFLVLGMTLGLLGISSSVFAVTSENADQPGKLLQPTEAATLLLEPKQ